MKHWYRKLSIVTLLLLPLSVLFYVIVQVRVMLYRCHILKSIKLPVPVMIVGNISVGGTGKTPLVIALCDYLLEKGYRPGVICRSYKASREAPEQVFAHSDPRVAGDEAVLLANRLSGPVVSAKNRVQAAQFLSANTDCNIIVSDDGLQHYALQRDIEIAVIDGKRRLGNGFCLPAGPLRETASRLNKVDMVVVNGKAQSEDEYAMTLQPAVLVFVSSDERLELSCLKNKTVHAVAGIGHPERFFETLRQLGAIVIPHAFPDHYQFQESDMTFSDEHLIVMTEKDAVKCRGFSDMNVCYLQVKAEIAGAAYVEISKLLKLNLDGNVL
jgi:tetraacyldisaccharide 4'-kinase